MLSLIVGLLGYWMGPDAFGASLINAVESINILFWIVGGIVAVIMLAVVGFTTIGGGAVGNDTAGKAGAVLGALVGGGFGLFVALFAFVKIGIMIWLTSYLAGSIDPLMTNLDGLTTSQVIAFVVIIVLPFTGGSSSSSSK